MTFFKSMKEEICSFELYRSILCEIVGISCLIGMAQLVVSQSSLAEDPSAVLRIGITIGMTLMCVIEMAGHISGAHVNPIITLAFILDGKTSVIRGLFYVPCQLLGATAGASFAYGVSSAAARKHLGGPALGPDITPVQGFFAELFITLFMVLVTLGSADEKLRPVFIPSLPVALSVSSSIMATASLTGGCMNPAVSFGPSVVNAKWDNHWVYWAGPVTGSIIATVIYKVILTFNAKKLPVAKKVDEDFIQRLADLLENNHHTVNHEYVSLLQPEARDPPTEETNGDIIHRDRESIL